MMSHMISCYTQDCVVLLAPYPNNPNPVESFNITTDFDLQGDGLVWYVCPQLFFNCTLCPTGAKVARVQCIPQGGFSRLLQLQVQHV